MSSSRTKARNLAEPPTRGAIFLSDATSVGPVMSRRRSVFSIPTTMTGRISPARMAASMSAVTCGKSSSTPPSGMYSTG